MNQFTVILILVSCLFYWATTQEGSENEYTDGSTTSVEAPSTTLDPHFQRCNHLNDIRANFTICCKYPSLVVWTWQMEACEKKCEDRRSDPDDHSCCVFACVLYVLRIIAESNDGKYVVDPKGIAYSYLLSVGNDTVWEPVTKLSTQRCYDDLVGTVEGYMCNVIPELIFKVTQCSFKENYLKCPVWNPHRMKQCEAAYSFVEECWEGIQLDD